MSKADEIIRGLRSYGMQFEADKMKKTADFMYEVADYIESLPTQYDVDKVVEQLDSLRPHGMVPLVDGFIEDAIKIVKEGGKDE